MKENVTFGEATEALEAGKMVRRASWTDKETFVFMQVPARIDKSIIPKMTSLPEEVKKELISRDVDIEYFNQFAIVLPDSFISGWAPKPVDVLSKDWVIL